MCIRDRAKAVANRLGYPVLVRPSYVLGGQGMQIAISDEEIEEFMEIINRIAQDHPILVDKYLPVSYTHLDVYKRQRCGHVGRAVRTPYDQDAGLPFR